MESDVRTRIAGVAVICGLGLGLWGALAENPFADWGGEQGLAATVNGATVTADDLTLAVEAVASDKRNAMTDEDRERILARLIDEELLIQRGVEVGLVDSDNTVRKAIVNAMIASILAEAGADAPQEQALRTLYDENPALYSGTARYQVSVMFFRAGNDGSSDDAVEARISTAERALRDGEDFSAVAARLADRPVVATPAAPLSPAKLRDYTGPSALRAVGALEAGGVTPPVAVPGGRALIRLDALVPGAPRPFAEVRGLVTAEYARRRDDGALRAYLNWLWGRADIDFADGYEAMPEATPEPSE